MTNIEDGDTVELTAPARLDRYWFDPDYMGRGSYDAGHALPGARGVVVWARTPCVTRGKGEPAYFANVDVSISGQTWRVRVFHNALRKVRTQGEMK